MNIFDVTKKVREHILSRIDGTSIIQTSGVVAYGKGEFLYFRNEGEALAAVADTGWIFSYEYLNGSVELLPVVS